jgi:hypothetical protein
MLGAACTIEERYCSRPREVAKTVSSVSCGLLGEHIEFDRIELLHKGSGRLL